MLKKLSLFVIVLGLLNGCSEPKKNIVEWPYGVNYEIFVLSFADSNGDGKGDFNGVTEKLDYLKELGIGGIWLMPIMNSPSYHKYDVVDYKSVHPDYGTVEDFKHLVEEAHKRDIQIIIDLILNHTGSDHPWFQEAIKGKDNPYRDYYVWAKKDSIRDQIAKKTISFDSDNITQWHAVNGDTLAEHYYGFFYGGMPDLNFDNEKVRAEFIDIGRFWLNDMDVDGFRLDAAKHIFPTDRAEDNHAFWVWFRSEMERIDPNVYFVGEVWSSAEEVAPYLKGLPALFNFDMGYAITSVVNAAQDTIGLIEKYAEITNFYQQTTRDYIDAVFLKNHDQNRILTELGNDPSKGKLAANILMTLPGTPYVYYGEEIGMLGAKPDEYIREPFLWGSGDPMQTSWEQPRYSTTSAVKPLSEQLGNPTSMVEHYRGLISYRNRSRALTYGDIELSGLKRRELVSFVRTAPEETLLVIHNVSDVEVTLAADSLGADFDEIDFTANGESKMSDGQLTIPARASVILK